MTIYLLPFVVEALGYNKKIYKDIDRLYQSRKYEFYKAAREHELYTHPIVTGGGLLQEEYCRKALGILLCVNKDAELAEEFMNIIRKGWTYAYLFVQNHTKIDLEKLAKNLIRKAGGLEQVSDDWINTQLFMAYFFAVNSKKTVIQNECLGVIERTLVRRWEHFREDDPARISLEHAGKNELTEVKNLRQKIYARHGIIKGYNDMYDKLRHRAETVAFLFDFERLSFPSIIENIKFTARDVDEILLAYISGGNDPEDVKAAEDFLCDAVYVKYMAKAYKEVKQRYFENNKETMYIELETLEKELAETKQEVARLNRILEETHKMLSAVEKENVRLKQELEVEWRNRHELNSLREFLFQMDQEEEYMPTEEVVDLEELKDFKAVLIGGHEKWQARLKEMLPEFIFIHTDNKTFDVRFLDGVEVLFVYVNYLNHAVYNRVMEAAAGRDIKIVYINRQNINYVLQDIWRVYQELKC